VPRLTTLTTTHTMSAAVKMASALELMQELERARLDVYAYRLYLFAVTNHVPGQGFRMKLGEMAAACSMSLGRLRDALTLLERRRMVTRDKYAGQEDRYLAHPPSEWAQEESAAAAQTGGGPTKSDTPIRSDSATGSDRTPAKIHQLRPNEGGPIRSDSASDTAQTPDGFPPHPLSLTLPPCPLKGTSPHGDTAMAAAPVEPPPALPAPPPPSKPRPRQAKPRPPWTEADVEAIYAAYPLKRGKGAALPKIRAALKAVSARSEITPAGAAAWLLERTTAFAESPKGRSGEYIPNPATWYNQARYDDEPAAWGIVQRKSSPSSAPVDRWM
jgi:hypothetical protein